MNSQKCCYARVSTAEQAKNKHALEQQLHRLNKTLPDTVYCDIQSGRQDDRPEFQKLLTAIKKGEVRRLTVTNIDRIARNGRISRDILEALRDSRTELYVLDKNRLIDLLDPDDWYDANQEGLRAERESDKISQRVNNGLNYFRSQGKANGSVPWGYVRNPETEKYELNQNPLPEYPDKKVWEVAREAVDLYLEHKNGRIVNEILGQKYDKQHSGLNRWLVNPVLRGHTRYKLAKNLKDCGQIVWNTHPDQALITETEYQAILRISKENRQKWGVNSQSDKRKDYYFSGLVICSECGNKMKYKSIKKGAHLYLQCSQHSLYGDSGCKNKKLTRVAEIEQQVISALTQKAQEITDMVVLDLPTEFMKSKEQLKLEARLEKLKNLQLADDLPEIDILINRTEQEISTIKLNSQVDKAVICRNIQILKDTFSKPEFFSYLSAQEKKQVYQDLIEKIVLDRGYLKAIEFKI